MGDVIEAIAERTHQYTLKHPKVSATAATLTFAFASAALALTHHKFPACALGLVSLITLSVTPQFKPLSRVRKEIFTAGYIIGGAVKLGAKTTLTTVQLAFRTAGATILAGIGVGCAYMTDKLIENGINFYQAHDAQSAAWSTAVGGIFAIAMCFAGKGAIGFATKGFPEDKSTQKALASGDIAISSTEDEIKVIERLPTLRERFKDMGHTLRNAPSSISAFRKKLDVFYAPLDGTKALSPSV